MLKHIRVYRAMSRKEYEVLERDGFETTFRRRWKYFTLNPEYICIIFNEPDYGLCPRVKYNVAVYFDIVFRVPLEELERMNLVRVFRERGYTTIAMRKPVVGFIEKIIWRKVNVNMLPCPQPMLVWRNKNGVIRKVYRKDKALRILERLKHRDRIIFINPQVLSE